MKIRRLPKSWPRTARAAIAAQTGLAARVRQTTPSRPLRCVAGLDAAFSLDGRHCIGGVVLWDTKAQTILEAHTAVRPVRFPYVPGLLSFRELPALLAALRKLKCNPDVLMCDGHGLAHPRRFGIACHLGVICGLPAIGCAKSLLVGHHASVGARRGSRSPLLHKGDIVGTVLRTQTSVRPVFVSIGHSMTLGTAERIILKCVSRYRLPEPTRLADHLVAKAKREAARD